MSDKILITGGAGFIGSRLALSLRKEKYEIIVYDNLNPQIHGKGARFSSALRQKGIRLIKADMLDKDSLQKALAGVRTVVHLAAETGVGQSMYEIERYVRVNISGTAVLLDLLAKNRGAVKKIVLASSRAVYGEGKYACKNCGVVYPGARTQKQLSAKKWDLACPRCLKKIQSLATDEQSPFSCGSVYSITKAVQEQLFENFSRTFKVPCVILRYQNVYGPGQSLNNPYTGIISIFLTRLRNSKPPLIFEDGQESRDFVFIDDVIKATVLAIRNKRAGQGVFNVGSGKSTSVLEVAQMLARKLGAKAAPQIIRKARTGDIRHCFADLAKIRKYLGFYPEYELDRGLDELIRWARFKRRAADLSEKANQELSRLKLFQ